jgi:GNAT superfamily N-acetyltransferase
MRSSRPVGEVPRKEIRRLNREWRREGFVVSTDKSRLDVGVVHTFLSSSYWAAGIPEEEVARSIEHSLCFGLYGAGGEQVGFARVITDYTFLAYLADVFVLDSHRGRGLGKWLVEAVTSHPELRGIRKWMLATGDAHELYRKYGFSVPQQPEMLMEKVSVPAWLSREDEVRGAIAPGRANAQRIQGGSS